MGATIWRVSYCAYIVIFPYALTQHWELYYSVPTVLYLMFWNPCLVCVCVCTQQLDFHIVLSWSSIASSVKPNTTVQRMLPNIQIQPVSTDKIKQSTTAQYVILFTCSCTSQIDLVFSSAWWKSGSLLAEAWCCSVWGFVQGTIFAVFSLLKVQHTSNLLMCSRSK